MANKNRRYLKNNIIPSPNNIWIDVVEDEKKARVMLWDEHGDSATVDYSVQDLQKLRSAINIAILRLLFNKE